MYDIPALACAVAGLVIVIIGGSLTYQAVKLLRLLGPKDERLSVWVALVTSLLVIALGLYMTGMAMAAVNTALSS